LRDPFKYPPVLLADRVASTEDAPILQVTSRPESLAHATIRTTTTILVHAPILLLLLLLLMLLLLLLLLGRCRRGRCSCRLTDRVRDVANPAGGTGSGG
jgi:hypothetical protein